MGEKRMLTIFCEDFCTLENKILQQFFIFIVQCGQGWTSCLQIKQGSLS
jgi:hypothetical protein